MYLPVQINTFFIDILLILIMLCKNKSGHYIYYVCSVNMSIQTRILLTPLDFLMD